MNASDVEILKRETVFQGAFRVDRYRLRHRRHDGGWTGEMTREVFERGHAAALLPYDPIRNEVVLIEQFRIGAFAAGFAPWLLEVIAGIIEHNEVPEDVVRREALEEADLGVLDLEPIGAFLLSQGAVSETTRLYCGRVDASDAGGIHGLADEHEDIKVLTVPASDIARLIDSGRVTNAVALIALQWFLLHGEDLRNRWGD